MKIYLVSCVSKKQNGIHAAKDLYCSDLFKKSRKYVEQQLEKDDKWFILSAEHGLLNPETQVEKYDKTLNKMRISERRNWANRVISALAKEITPSTEIIFLAGKNYTEFLTKWLNSNNIRYTDLLKGKKIGERLSFLA